MAAWNTLEFFRDQCIVSEVEVRKETCLVSTEDLTVVSSLAVDFTRLLELVEALLGTLLSTLGVVGVVDGALCRCNSTLV